MLTYNPLGNFSLLAAPGRPYSGGAVTEAGFDLVHASFASPIPLEAGLSALVRHLASTGRYDAIVCNYANGDMVGHTGNLDAAIKAIETLDACVGRVVAAAREVGGEVLITADHGNAEKMHDEATGQPHTAHTLFHVPCVYVGRGAAIAAGGSLQDIAPTLLAMLGLPQPAEMTGRSLVTIA